MTCSNGISKLESALVTELGALLEGVQVGGRFVIPPSADFCYSLELFVPAKLRVVYPEWENEGLDGLFVAEARKIAPSSADITGTCILIRDQTVTPCRLHLRLSDSKDSVAAYDFKIGEKGSGALGISGPPCNSRRARRLLERLMERLEEVRWEYSVSSH